MKVDYSYITRVPPIRGRFYMVHFPVSPFPTSMMLGIPRSIMSL